MAIRHPVSEAQLEELRGHVDAHHPVWAFDTVEEERLEALLWDLAERVGLPYFSWSPTTGLVRHGPGGGKPPGTETLARCLAFVEQASLEAIFHIKGVSRGLDEAEVEARIKAIARRYFEHRGALVLSGAPLEMPRAVDALCSHFVLEPPTLDEYRAFVQSVVYDVAGRRPVEIALDEGGVTALLQALSGLTLLDVRKVISRALVNDGKLAADDLAFVYAAKRRIVEREGLLELFPHDMTLEDVAGLSRLKAWLGRRHRAFLEPSLARAHGLTPPKGLLLIGVQGCGKSLTAKAIAAEWRLPIVKLDPSRLFQKYFGESERALRRALATAEALAPVVLWVDELEKGFAQGGDDGGTSLRVLGTFLSWLQEKKTPVFVVATANDVSRMPPELLRKGRFDEIFFLDLPDADARARVLRTHLGRRGHDPARIDLARVAEATQGLSGAELEQLVVSALFATFEAQAPLTTEALLEEAAATRPLSVTMAEKIDALRDWARDRAVSAD